MIKLAVNLLCHEEGIAAATAELFSFLFTHSILHGDRIKC